MLKRIYIDTSVIGGCLDAEFRQPSEQLWQMFKTGDAKAVVSDLTLVELELSPPAVRSKLAELPAEAREHVELDDESGALSQMYMLAGIVTEKYLLDAQHIAVATVNRVDVLVSWNFRHIVNLRRVQGFNSVNLRHGYPLLEIRSPWEVLTYGEEG